MLQSNLCEHHLLPALSLRSVKEPHSAGPQGITAVTKLQAMRISKAEKQLVRSRITQCCCKVGDWRHLLPTAFVCLPAQEHSH